MREPEVSLKRALAELSALHPKKIDLGLERIERVLETLGNPQHKLPPIVHVAGTNGKGSTLAYLRAFCEAQGLTAHVYTSPHLVHFQERIIVRSQEISNAALIDVLTRVRKANGEAPLSFFEATTAAMFLAFSEIPADIALIEVGLGGRFDATNVITPACVGITPIDYDHAEFLGRDLATIARTKAGIMKRHCPVFIGSQSELVRAVLENEARKLSATPKVWGQDFRAYRQHGRLVFENKDNLLDLPPPALIGEHQILNAGLAIAIAKNMQISDAAIAKGLQKVRWPARMQNLTTGLLADKVQTVNGELWLDGGHNPHAARAIANAVAELEAKSPRPLILITGILSNKDIGGFLDAFEGLATEIIGVTIPGHASLAPETLTELAKSRGLNGHVADTLEDAIDYAVKTAEPPIAKASANPVRPPRVLICGSLYLAGEVLKLSQ